jgi:hypothetical protein
MASLPWFRIGALSAGLAVVMGAFGAHGLKSKISDEKLLKTWETAAHYHLIHSVGKFTVHSFPYPSFLSSFLFPLPLPFCLRLPLQIVLPFPPSSFLSSSSSSSSS